MFATQLTRLRDNSGMPQQLVAQKLGMARATYANLESDKKSPTLEQIQAIATLFEIPVEELIDGSVDTKPSPKVVKIKFKEKPKNDIEPREVINEKVETLREVLLYVLDKVGAKPNIGETVLYKLLYFIDFDYYEKTGKSVTGMQYIKNHYGPTPTQSFGSVVQAMKEKGELETVETKHFSHKQKKYLPVIKPSLNQVSGEELRHIDEVLARLSDKNASELSTLSHRDMPWLATKDGAIIDYQLAMYRTSETSVKETEDEL